VQEMARRANVVDAQLGSQSHSVPTVSSTARPVHTECLLVNEGRKRKSKAVVATPDSEITPNTKFTDATRKKNQENIVAAPAV